MLTLVPAAITDLALWHPSLAFGNPGLEAILHLYSDYSSTHILSMCWFLKFHFWRQFYFSHFSPFSSWGMGMSSQWFPRSWQHWPLFIVLWSKDFRLWEKSYPYWTFEDCNNILLNRWRKWGEEMSCLHSWIINRRRNALVSYLFISRILSIWLSVESIA